MSLSHCVVIQEGCVEGVRAKSEAAEAPASSRAAISTMRTRSSSGSSTRKATPINPICSIVRLR